jgi:hypothetical protein
MARHSMAEGSGPGWVLRSPPRSITTNYAYMGNFCKAAIEKRISCYRTRCAPFPERRTVNPLISPARYNVLCSSSRPASPGMRATEWATMANKNLCDYKNLCGIKGGRLCSIWAGQARGGVWSMASLDSWLGDVGPGGELPCPDLLLDLDVITWADRPSRTRQIEIVVEQQVRVPRGNVAPATGTQVPCLD